MYTFENILIDEHMYKKVISMKVIGFKKNVPPRNSFSGIHN